MLRLWKGTLDKNKGLGNLDWTEGAYNEPLDQGHATGGGVLAGQPGGLSNNRVHCSTGVHCSQTHCRNGERDRQTETYFLLKLHANISLQLQLIAQMVNLALLLSQSAAEHAGQRQWSNINHVNKRCTR